MVDDGCVVSRERESEEDKASDGDTSSITVTSSSAMDAARFATVALPPRLAPLLVVAVV